MRTALLTLVLSVLSIFKWYGDDFIPGFADVIRGERADILGVIARYGPATA